MVREQYEMKQLEFETDIPFSSLDYLFIAAGASHRAYKVLDILERIKIKKLIVIDFIERRESEKIYQEKYYSYKNRNIEIITLNANINDSSGLLKSLVVKGVDIKRNDNIGIDITCFPRPFIFSFLKYFQKVNAISHANVFYSEPKAYVFKNGFCKTFKSSSGPIKIIELPTFTGENINDTDRLLIVVLGFDADLSKEINFEVAPKKTVLINGFPGFSPKFKEISLINNEVLIANQNNEIAYCKANNPFEMYNTLLDIYLTKGKELFVNIAPIGPKPLVLGTCLFAIHHPSVRVIYPQPEKYLNEDTSNDTWCSWYYKLPLYRVGGDL